MRSKKKIAIVGGGISGLTAAYQLNQKHEITLFEKADRLGGNAYTHTTHDGESVDIAVAAFGKHGYPNFYALLAEVGIRPRLSPGSFMTLHDLEQKDGIAFTFGWDALRMQGFRSLKPKSLKMVLNLFWGLTLSQRRHRAGGLSTMTVRELLDDVPAFTEDARIMLMSVFCLLSSMSGQEVMDAPAAFFIEKLRVHSDFLSVHSSYAARCVDLGTQTYIRAMSDRFSPRIVLNARIRGISRSDSGITLVMEDGTKQVFDAVVLACNADQALALLESPTNDEKRILGAWKYKEGRIVLHRDHSSFPPKKLIQAYTFLYTGGAQNFETSVSGAVWRLPQASKNCDYICTQHPNFPIREDLIELDTVLRTPIFDAHSVAASPELPKLNGVLNTYYCGSHFGFGLHEDAVTSAVKVGECLGVALRIPPPNRTNEVLEIVEDLSRWLWRRNLDARN